MKAACIVWMPSMWMLEVVSLWPSHLHFSGEMKQRGAALVHHFQGTSFSVAPKNLAADRTVSSKHCPGMFPGIFQSIFTHTCMQTHAHTCAVFPSLLEMQIFHIKKMQKFQIKN